MGTAVSMLDDLPALVPILKDLGAKHVKYGVKDAHCECQLSCISTSSRQCLRPCTIYPLPLLWYSNWFVMSLADSVVGKALITLLEKQLGSLWTAEVQSAWIHIFDVVSTTMKQGAAATNDA